MSIPNLKPIEDDKLDNIWRGGQPELVEDLENLKYLGINQVIKLNTEGYMMEQDTCKWLGMDFFYCPITTTEQILTEPDLQSIRDAVGFIGPGTFVHCEHGQDRTGIAVALWRISQGWTVEQARDEMLANGYHPILVGLEKAWEDLIKGKP